MSHGPGGAPRARPRTRGPLVLACVLPAAFLLGMNLACVPLAAQVEREAQVEILPDRDVDEIDADLRGELGLFPEVDGFVSARLFESAAGAAVLEITLREDGRLVRERRRLSPGDLRALRDRVGAALDALPAGRRVDAEGRGGLVVAETLLGLGYYGWAVPDVLDIESDRGRVGAYLLTSGATFGLAYHLTRSRDVTPAHRDAVVWGGTRGILYGAVLGDALTLGDDDELGFEEIAADDESDRNWTVGLGMAGSVAGSVLGYRLVSAGGADRGTVAHFSTVADLATAYGFAASLALGLYDGEQECSFGVCTEPDTEARTAGHLVALGLGAAGGWGAARWASRSDYSVGDARALLSAGLLGGQLALPLAWALFEDMDDGERPLAATLLAGSAAGLWAGDRLLRDRELSASDGLLVQAGQLAGGALGLGLAYLVDDDDRDGELLYMSAAAAGSLAGAWLTFRAFADGGDPGRAGAGGPEDRGLEVHVGSLGTLAGLLVGGEPARPVDVRLLTLRR